MKKSGILVITFAVFLLAGCGGTDYTKLEKDMTTKASKYYVDNIKDKVLNINNHKVTIEALEASKVDVKEFTTAKCDKTSYVLIKLTLDAAGKQVGNYKTETHLTCGTYSTATK